MHVALVFNVLCGLLPGGLDLGGKWPSFRYFFSLSALCLSVILNFHFIYAIIKPTVSEDTGLIYGFAF